MRFAVTGAGGLLGWHTAARLHARNCAARFRGDPDVVELVLIDRAVFSDDIALRDALEGCDAVLHFAGVNRGADDAVEVANPAIAERLINGCRAAGVRPHVVYANSTHSSRDNPYGRGKRKAGQLLAESGFAYTDLVLPHIFGECARPDYNNVTATLIDRLWKGELAQVTEGARVQLLHAGEAAEIAIDAASAGTTGTLQPEGRDILVTALNERLREFHALYTANVFPDLSDPFDLHLFNAYRTAAYPHRYPFALAVNEDHRGRLFESAKGGSASHTFLSTTHPGKIRGDHFHLDLVERFLVVSGEAIIRIRRVLSEEVHEFRVSGDKPVAIDQIPLHTHNIENVGESEVVTFFWSDHVFNPERPDTYADPV